MHHISLLTCFLFLVVLTYAKDDKPTAFTATMNGAPIREGARFTTPINVRGKYVGFDIQLLKWYLSRLDASHVSGKGQP